MSSACFIRACVSCSSAIHFHTLCIPRTLSSPPPTLSPLVVRLVQPWRPHCNSPLSSTALPLLSHLPTTSSQIHPRRALGPHAHFGLYPALPPTPILPTLLPLCLAVSSLLAHCLSPHLASWVVLLPISMRITSPRRKI